MGGIHLMSVLIAYVRIFIAFILGMFFYFCSILSYSLLVFSFLTFWLYLWTEIRRLLMD